MGAYVNGKWNELVPNLTPTGGSVGGDPSPDPTHPGISSQPGGSAYIATNGGNGGGGGGGGGSAPAASGGLDQSLQKMLAALASGNAQAFQESKDEFNKNYELAVAGITGSYQGNPTEAVKEFNQQLTQSASQFAQNFGLQQAQVTGQYNGAPTEQAREFNQNQAASLLNAATQLRGPANYLQYQTLTHGGQSLMQQLFGNRPAGASATPTGYLQSANLQNALGDLGLQQGANGLSPMAAGAPTGGSGQADPSSSILLSSFGLAPGSTLNPNQIDPSRWDAIGATGQALTKNLASTLFGYDPNDFEAQVNATRPQGTAQRTSSYASAAPQGLF